MRGGVFPLTRFDGSPWFKPAQTAVDASGNAVQAAATEMKPVADAVSAPVVDGMGVAPGGTNPEGGPILGPTASMGGRRRRTRRHKRRHSRKH